MNNENQEEKALLKSFIELEDQDPLRRWTRADLAAIAGAPLRLPLVIAAALLGKTVAEVKAMINAGSLLGETRVGKVGVDASQFIKPEASVGENPPLMLCRRRLRVRPTSNPMDLAALQDKNGNLAVEGVRSITGQTAEEVIADLKSGRLMGQRLRSRRWTINGQQFLSSYKEIGDDGPVRPFASWTRAELAAIAGTPYSIPFETAAALLGESLKEFKAKNKTRTLIVTRLESRGVSQALAAQFLRREDYFTVNLSPPRNLRNGELHIRLPQLPDDVARLADANGNLTIEAVRTFTGQTAEEVETDMIAGRLQHVSGSLALVPAGQFLRAYRADPKI